MSKAIKTLHILISGIVQGVGFRYNLKNQATCYQLTGWCRNLRDSRVEAIIQGDSKSIKAVLDWCQQGPMGARVDEVLIKEIENTRLENFEIRGTV